MLKRVGSDERTSEEEKERTAAQRPFAVSHHCCRPRARTGQICECNARIRIPRGDRSTYILGQDGICKAEVACLTTDCHTRDNRRATAGCVPREENCKKITNE